MFVSIMLMLMMMTDDLSCQKNNANLCLSMSVSMPIFSEDIFVYITVMPKVMFFSICMVSDNTCVGTTSIVI